MEFVRQLARGVQFFRLDRGRHDHDRCQGAQGCRPARRQRCALGLRLCEASGAGQYAGQYAARYFDRDAPTTRQWQAVLSEVAAVRLSVTLPDLSASLKAVREAQGNKEE